MSDAEGGPEAVWDPGMQNERTSLAWTRTCLAYGICALLCARLSRHTPAAAVVALVGIAAAGMLLGTVHHRYRRMNRDLFAGRPLTSVREIALLTAMTAALAVAAGVLILVRT